MRYVIRGVHRSDIPEMHRVRLSVRENRLSDPTRVQPRDYERLLEAGGAAWVAEIDGRIIGFAFADLARASVWALFVDPAYERRGIGRDLHACMMHAFFATDVDVVRLSTEAGTRAERFYERLGWTSVGPVVDRERSFELTRSAWQAACGRETEDSDVTRADR